MRNNQWLRLHLDNTWDKHFQDINQINPISIKFGRQSYQRLGSIILKSPPSDPGKYVSHITISSVLANENIPDIIVDQVIAHELVHYIHGFGSRLPRHLRHPHQGGVIVKEYKSRGLWELYRAYRAWMKLHWVNFLHENYPRK